jgi:hypothetical protein
VVRAERLQRRLPQPIVADRTEHPDTRTHRAPGFEDDPSGGDRTRRPAAAPRPS